MDIRKWLNKSPKGLTKEPKSPKLKQKVKKKHQLDSSSEDEEEIVTVMGLELLVDVSGQIGFVVKIKEVH